MVGGLNRVTVIGNVGKEPDIKSFSNGGKIANFSVAVTEEWKDKQTGEKKSKTEWINIAVHGGLVGVVERFVNKGTKVFVEGKLQTRKWQDQSGNDRYTTEVVLQGFNAQLILLSAPRSDGGGNGGQQRGQSSGGDWGRGGSGSAGGGSGGGWGESGGQGSFGGGGGYAEDLDDDIPF